MDKPKRPSERLVESLLSTLPLGDFFTPESLAAQMKRPLAWVHAGIASGEIPARRVRGEWVISKAALNARLSTTAQGTRASAEDAEPGS